MPSSGGSSVCTGALLNDRASSGTPLFATAHHCISTSDAASSHFSDIFPAKRGEGSDRIIKDSNLNFFRRLGDQYRPQLLAEVI